MTMTNVCVFGDSVAKGVVFDQVKQRYGLLKENFVNLCSSALGLHQKNYSKFGCTIEKGAEMVDIHAKELADNSCVVLEFGGNDCDFDWPAIAADPAAEHLPKTPLADFTRRYSELIENVRTNGGVPVLLNLPPIDPHKYFRWVSRGVNGNNILKWLGGDETFIYRWHETYSVEIAKIGMMHSVPVIDIRTPFLERRDYSELLCEDGIHPNEAGHKLISETLEKVMETGQL